MLAKAALKAQLPLAPAPWDGWLGGLLTASALATTLIVARFLFLVRPQATAPAPSPVPRGLLWPWVGLLVAVAIGAWQIPFEGARAVFAPAALGQALWPVAVGLALAAGIGWLWVGVLRRQAPALPPGDVWVWVEQVGRASGRVLRAAGRAIVARRPSGFEWRWPTLGQADAALVYRLPLWIISLVLFVVLAVMVVLLVI